MLTSTLGKGALQLSFDVTPPTNPTPLRKRNKLTKHPHPGARSSSHASAHLSNKKTLESSQQKAEHHEYARPTPLFHADGSSIASDRFAMKFLFGDRSYLIQGAYRIHDGKSRYDGDESVSIEAVRIDRIYAYKNGAYVFIPITKNEKERFERAVFEVLTNPYHNNALSEPR